MQNATVKYLVTNYLKFAVLFIVFKIVNAYMHSQYDMFDKSGDWWDWVELLMVFGLIGYFFLIPARLLFPGRFNFNVSTPSISVKTGSWDYKHNSDWWGEWAANRSVVEMGALRLTFHIVSFILVGGAFYIGIMNNSWLLVFILLGIAIYIIYPVNIGFKNRNNIVNRINKKSALIDAYQPADFASQAEVQRVLGSGVRGINVGNGLMWSGEGHIMTCAPSRSGKGYYLINTTLTDDFLGVPSAPSFVVLDPKGENIMISGAFLKRMGYKVICINPYDIAGLDEFGKGRYNPLENLDPNSEEIDEIIDTIGYSILPLTNDKNRFFTDSARDLIINYIRHLITQTEDEISFRTLYYYVLANGTELEEILRKMAINTSFEGIVSKYALSVAGQKGTDTWGSVSRTAQTAMTMFGRKRLSESLAGSDFKMTDLDKEKVAVFLCMPSDIIEKNAPWLRIFFGSMLRDLMKNYHPQRRVIVLLDEFIKLGYLKEAENFFTIGAHYATIWAVIQDLDSLSKVYEGWQSLVGNSRIIHWFASGDNMTREYVSKRMPMTIKFLGSNEDGSPKYIEKPLLRPDEVGSFPDILIEVQGLKSPGRLQKVPYLQQNNNGRNLRA